jgi:sugar lactone lactonase YvrE
MRKSLSGAIFSTLILLSIIIGVTGCTKTPTLSTSLTAPSVVTYNVISSLTQTTAQSGGITTNGNGGDILGNGVCWSSTNQVPTIADSKTADTVNATGFTSRITGLTPGTKYYLRAYSSNAAGPGYGAVITFTTPTSLSSLTTTVTTFAGSTSGTYGFLDGTGTAALFSGPQGLAYNPVAGNIYVMDALNNAIRTVTTGAVVTTLTNPALGLINGPLATAQFYGPRSVAFDAAGNAYVADYGNNVIRKITPAGAVTTFAGSGIGGYVEGAGNQAQFNGPQGVAVDAKGNVYVADRYNNAIRKITPAGVVSTLAGYLSQVVSGLFIAGYLDGTGTTAAFSQPTAVACDAAGNVYVADNGNHAVRMITPAAVVTTLAGNPVQKNVVGAPSSIGVDATGNIFITDESGRVLEITAAKVLYTLAGTLNTAGFVNGTGAASLFSSPQGVTVDTQGNVYVSDFNNNVIRKIVVKFQ